MSRHPTLALLAVLAAPLQAQPRIYENGAVNAASYLSPAVPGGAIAQGSIFSIFGENLGSGELQAREFPIPTTLGGVQALILVADGQTLEAPLLYVSPNQINAILPSAVPAGRHLLRTQLDGVPSNDLPIKVVEASLGLFFSQEQGVPVAAAHAATPFFSRLVSLATPARPGDAVILWGTGLGPVSGSDDRSAAVSALRAQVEVLVAGRPVTATYAGRSSCCAGVDQINIEIPQDAPTGCVVPLVVRVNGNVSNHVALPIGADGVPCDPRLSFHAGRVNLTRQWSEDIATDSASALFDQPLGPLDPTRLPPVGTCMVWREAPGSGDRWFDVGAFVSPHRWNHVGDAVSLTTPAGVFQLGGASYSIPDPPSTNFLGPGAYQASAPGGDSFPPFDVELLVNPAPVLEAWDPTSVFARDLLANLTWFGGDPSASGVVWSGAFGRGFPEVVCNAAVAGGQFQVPPYVWANQPSGPRQFAFGAIQSAELMTPTDGPDHGLLVYREEFPRQGDLGPPHLASTPVTLPSGEKIQAELAATASERARGLMQRPVLDPDSSMLFLFESPGIYRFWMLNTIIPLDILWLDSNREIFFISADTPPCQTQICPAYGPDAPARYVLEIAAGEAARRGLKPGDRLSW